MIEDGWFGSLAPPVRAMLLAQARELQLAPGQCLYRRGEPPDAFYGVARGYLKISNLYEDGREALLSIAGPGNWLGEQSLVEGGPRLHDVHAVGDCQLLVVARERFDALMQAGPFAAALSRLLAARLRWLYAVMEDASWHPPRVRLARRLLLLARGDALLSSTSRMDIPVSQEALALMLGISRQTLSKELHALADGGAVAIGYGHIGIESFEALERLAQ